MDIISKANKNNNLLTEELFKVIEQSERIIVEKQCAIKQEEPIKHQSPKIDIEKPKTNFKKTENPKKTIISDNEENYIEKKYQELLLNKGFILLKPMNSLRRKKIHEIVSKYDDMDSFSIGKDEERQIVLRYSPHINEFLDVQALINEAKQSYKEKKYNKTIYTNYRLLEISKKPRATIFAALGLSYLKIKQIDKAIECLTIATKIDDIKNKFDFTELILDLKNNLDPEDRKPIIKMNNNELFQNDEWYGINCIEELNSLILDNNLDFMSACLEFGLNVEQIDIVKLIYAKYYFAEGNIKKAEEFLKSYEQSTTKTEKTLKIYTEIRKNKKLYINKKEMDKKLELSLTLKP